MKKIILGLSILVIAVTTIFLACKKNSDSCKTCRVNPNFTLTNTEISGNAYQLKMYANRENSFFLQYKSEKDFSKLEAFLAELEVDRLLNNELNNSIVNSIIIFSNEKPTVEFKLKSQSVQGVLFYLINNAGQMRTLLINTEGGEPAIMKKFSLNTEILTTNDIVDISKQGFAAKAVSATAFINFGSLPKKNLQISNLQKELAVQKINLSNAKVTAQGPAHYCDVVTCESASQGYCTAQESQSTGEYWFCLFTSEEQLCPKRVTNTTSPEGMNTEVQDDSLYSFRDNYMASRVKGAVYINRYYQLSELMEIDSLDIPFCLSTLSVVENKILPIINSLKSNPTSSTILYNTQVKDDIVNYLLIAKNKYASQTAKDYIDQIISDVNFLANKSANDVNNYLSTP